MYLQAEPTLVHYISCSYRFCTMGVHLTTNKASQLNYTAEMQHCLLHRMLLMKFLVLTMAYFFYGNRSVTPLKINILEHREK